MKKVVITLFVIVLITATILATRLYVRNRPKPPAPKSPQVLAIENTGLIEFSPGLVEVEITSPTDRTKYEKMSAILKTIGDENDPAKNTQAIRQLDHFIVEYPRDSEAYFTRAMLELSLPTPDYAKVLKDLDKTDQLNSSTKPKNPLVTPADVYVARAKVNLHTGDDQQAIADLESAIKSNPSSSVFNNGGVKAEEETANRAAMQNRDFEYLVSKYPSDFRVYMARGMFYDSFAFYSEGYFSSAFADLNHARELNPNSALVEYLVGNLYQQTTYKTKAAWTDISESGGYKDQQNKIALQHFQRAIAIDPNFTEAWADRAEAFYSMKQYKDAISCYDKVIELDPTRWGAYNDRGMAKAGEGDYYDAIADFTEALTIKKENHAPDTALDTTYESRADAYLKARNYDSAVADYGRAIGVKLSSMVFLMSLAQIRGVYPELHAISDADLLEGLRQKYFPNMTSADFVGQYQTNLKPYEDFVLAGLYENRGDAYLASNNFQRAEAEYDRVRQMDSSFNLNRWKSISKDRENEVFVDIQTIDFGNGNIVSLWIKSTTPKSPVYTVEREQIDCANRKIKLLGSIDYDALGNPKTSRESDKDWELVAPETLGETIANGACKR